MAIRPCGPELAPLRTRSRRELGKSRPCGPSGRFPTEPEGCRRQQDQSCNAQQKHEDATSCGHERLPGPLPDVSDIEDTQLQRPADGVRAVLDVELAQDLLDVILDRERADTQDGSDLEVALAEMDPAQDLLLSRAERVDALQRRAALLERTPELRAHPCEVQERDHQFESRGVLLAEVSGHCGQDKQADGLADRIVGAVRYDAVHPETLQLGGERAARERHAAACAARACAPPSLTSSRVPLSGCAHSPGSRPPA